MNEIKNIAEAKALVEKYRGIKAKDIERLCDFDLNFFDANEIMRKLTGFGDARTCRLCKPISVLLPDEYAKKTICVGCIYYEIRYDNFFRFACNNETYQNIEDAETINELLEALKDRADYIESLINFYESKS